MIKIDILDSDSQCVEFPYVFGRSKYAVRVCGTLTEVQAILDATSEEYSLVETTYGTATAFVAFDRFSEAENLMNVVSTFFNCKDNDLDFNEAVAACEE